MMIDSVLDVIDSVSNDDDQVASDDQIAGDDQVASDDQVAGDDQVVGDDHVVGDDLVAGDDQVASDDQVAGDAQVVGDDQVNGSDLIDDDSSSGSMFSDVWHAVTDFVTPFIDNPEVDLPSHESYELVDIETFSLSPVVSSSGLKGVLLDVIGPYDNIITQYRYQANNSTSYSYVHETTPDYPWIASSILFICLVLSLFSLLKRFFTWMK